MEFEHEPVLRGQVVELFTASGPPPRRFVDLTVGGAGHAEALLDAGVGSERYIAVDRDPEAVAVARERLERFGDRVSVLQAPFSAAVLSGGAALGGPVDGLFADLGVSSFQLDTARRGFAFRAEAALDMRMDPTSGESAAELIERTSESDLARIFQRFGEVPAARRIAAAVKRASEQGALRTTTELKWVVESHAPAAMRRRAIHPATLVFQALRIAVNDELGELRSLLGALEDVVAPGGRVGVISFHSLEDRAVKRRFRELTTPPPTLPGVPLLGAAEAEWTEVSRKGWVADDAELDRNPRSRSARLRGIRRRGRKGQRGHGPND